MLHTYILDFLIPSSNILVTSFPKEDQGEDKSWGRTIYECELLFGSNLRFCPTYRVPSLQR